MSNVVCYIIANYKQAIALSILIVNVIS